MKVPPGALAVSDPVTLATSAGTELTISVYYPESIPQQITRHDNAAESNVLIRANVARNRPPAPAETSLPHTYFLTGVDVESTVPSGTVVAIGDSITDGGARRWPALLARRLADTGKNYGVLNAGISGNRLLRDGEVPWPEVFGQSALNRFDRDVLNQPGVKYVILYEGINDLGLSTLDCSNPPTVADITAAIRLLAQRARQRGLKFYAATLAPFEGTLEPGYYSRQKNHIREGINEWIRGSRDIDGYFDFDRALADPAQPDRMSPALDSSDHLHPNDAGEQVLSKAVDLSMFD